MKKALVSALLCLASSVAWAQYPGYKPDPTGPDDEGYSAPKKGLGEWQDKNYSWAVKIGAQLEWMPGKYDVNGTKATRLEEMDPAFALVLANEYHFYKPMWLQVATGIGVNGNYFDWGLQVGLLFKILPGHFTPTFRGAIAFDWKTYWEDASQRSTTNFFLGGAFGPGFRFILGDDMDKAIFIDFDFFVGRALRETVSLTNGTEKGLYFAFYPMVGLEF